jgi:FMN phosphatase YigB (HAD superfamily)
MNRSYFEHLVNHLKAKPEDCIYVDEQAQVLEAAAKLGMKIFSVEKYHRPINWWQDFLEFLAKETL